MIIRPDHDSVLFITQPDHARLATDLIAGWQDDGFPAHPRRDAILRAAAEHDNGWIEEDGTTIVDASGEPLDFIAAPVTVKQRIWPRAAARLEAEPYVAALVAHHALTVNTQPRTDPLWRGFFERMTAIEAALLARAGDLAPHLDADYRFVAIADQLSLVFCNGWTAPFPLGGGRRTILNGTTLEVSPDPFGDRRLPLGIAARRLPARRYESAADLRAALARAPIEWIEGAARGCP